MAESTPELRERDGSYDKPTLGERSGVVDVGIDRIEAEAQSDDGHVRPSSVAHRFDLPGELTNITAA